MIQNLFLKSMGQYVFNQTNGQFLMLSLLTRKKKIEWIKIQTNNTTKVKKPENKNNIQKYVNWLIWHKLNW